MSLMKFAAFHSRVHLIRKDPWTSLVGTLGGSGWRLGSSILEKCYLKDDFAKLHGHVPWLYTHEDFTKTQYFDDPTKDAEDPLLKFGY